MHEVNQRDLAELVNKRVQVCIQGEDGEDKAPWIDRKIHQLSLCPDKTHLRIYFDQHFFVAVPLTSSVKQDDHGWIAYDKTTRLYYAIKK
ncbi:hypothetical protein [Aquibacillus salsiterrae]|uniref:Uncharacterized protein n=1 Tax=Aquibacillus salsiterrae TaxID=2950439 RepID=A0A9X4AH71_9BACI|nr:hypothetical protein [Aquibacillus salsiterrae]MDC3417863.1 hypothetical protein [Aquibacillus salsiterrae]